MARFPHVSADNLPTSLMPRLPMTLTLGDRSAEFVEKTRGETAHVERQNDTLRQRLARYVRKTLSLSKLEVASLTA